MSMLRRLTLFKNTIITCILGFTYVFSALSTKYAWKKCLTMQHWCSFVEFSIGSSNMVTNCIDRVEKDVWTHMNKWVITIK
jgi:hypothetical protein